MKLRITTRGHFIAFPEYEQKLGFMETEYRVPTNEIPEYVDAFRVNFHTYETRKAVEDDSIYIGKKGMMIYLTGPYEGVCLFEHYRPVKTKEELDAIIKEMESFIGK